MYTLHYICYHLPEMCKGDHHKNRVFVRQECQVKGFPSKLTAYQALEKWNKDSACYQYCPTDCTLEG